MSAHPCKITVSLFGITDEMAGELFEAIADLVHGDHESYGDAVCGMGPWTPDVDGVA